MKSTRLMLVFLGMAAALLLSSAAQANMSEMKLYKEAFPGATLKCVSCHVDAMPKKDDGKHENNAYGKAVLAEAQKEAAVAEVKPTAETYKKVGKIEDFKE